MKSSIHAVLVMCLLTTACAGTGEKPGDSKTYDMAELPEYEWSKKPEPVNISDAKVPREVFTECLGGSVEVAFVIDKQGKAQQIQVLHAEPGETFIKAAAQAIFATEFEPMMVDGEAAAAKTSRTVEFSKPPDCE